MYTHDDTISAKLNKLISRAMKIKSEKRRKFNRNSESEVFIKSTIEDDHENLREDYQEEVKLERAARQKTIQSINNNLLSTYASLVDKGSTQKNKLIKFKKESKVVKVYSSHDDVYRPPRNFNSVLSIQKEDYGIYSRSINKALYYKKDNEVNEEAPNRKYSNKNIEKSFYCNYLGSYSERKNILRHS